jgi:hypothetical protein
MSRQPRLLTMIVLACALFLRVAVPAGWMPAANGGTFAIEPCAAANPTAHAMGKADHHDPSHKAQHNGDCAFAPLHAGVAAAAHTPPLFAPLLVTSRVADHLFAPFFATGPPALPPPATGPPAIA